MTADFNMVGLDLDDPEAVEHRWNDWVRGLFQRGYRPAEEPLDWTDDKITYELLAVGGLRDAADTAGGRLLTVAVA